MAYFNGFPATYQQMYPYTPQSQPKDTRVWVQGEESGKAYLVAPGNTIPLWDSESRTIYLKSANASGIPSMVILDYTVREPAKTPSNPVPVAKDDNLSVYATKDEIEAITGEITALRERLDKITKEGKHE